MPCARGISPRPRGSLRRVRTPRSGGRAGPFRLFAVEGDTAGDSGTRASSRFTSVTGGDQRVVESLAVKRHRFTISQFWGRPFPRFRRPPVFLGLWPPSLQSQNTASSSLSVRLSVSARPAGPSFGHRRVSGSPASSSLSRTVTTPRGPRRSLRGISPSRDPRPDLRIPRGQARSPATAPGAEYVAPFAWPVFRRPQCSIPNEIRSTVLQVTVGKAKIV